MHGRVDILCGDEFEGHLLWEGLANQSVHVFVGAAFPGGIRIGKEEVRIKRSRDAFMLGELTPVVAGAMVQIQDALLGLIIDSPHTA